MTFSTSNGCDNKISRRNNSKTFWPIHKLESNATMVKHWLILIALLASAEASFRNDRPLHNIDRDFEEVSSRKLMSAFGFPSGVGKDEEIAIVKGNLAAKKAAKHDKGSKISSTSPAPSSTPEISATSFPSSVPKGKTRSGEIYEKAEFMTTTTIGDSVAEIAHNIATAARTAASAPASLSPELSTITARTKGAKRSKGTTPPTVSPSPSSSTVAAAPTKGAKRKKGNKATTSPTLTASPSSLTDTSPSSAPTKGAKRAKGAKATTAPSLSPSPSSSPFPTRTKGTKSAKASTLLTLSPSPSSPPDTDTGSTSNSGKADSTHKNMARVAPAASDSHAKRFDSVVFYHRGPNKDILVSADDLNHDNVGTVYLYGGALYDVNAKEIPSANFTGVCTKTQKKEIIDGKTLLAGGGYCHFTYILARSADGQPLITMNAVGEVFDIVGGVMAITGGTDVLKGASGQTSILPLYDVDGKTDFFRHALAYEVNSTIF